MEKSFPENLLGRWIVYRDWRGEVCEDLVTEIEGNFVWVVKEDVGVEKVPLRDVISLVIPLPFIEQFIGQGEKRT